MGANFDTDSYAAGFWRKTEGAKVMSNKFDEAPPIEARYAVEDDADVTVTVTIGSGQFGSIAVRLNNAKIAGGEGKLHVRLGQGRDVRRTTVEILSVVNDVNPMTNRTEVKYVLTGGAVRTLHSEHTATRDFGVVLHYAAILLD